MVLPEPPLPFGGAAARWYYAAQRGLTERGHRLTTFISGASAAKQAEALALFPAPQHDLRFFPVSERRGLTGKAQSFWRPYSHTASAPLCRAVAAEVARGCDVVHLEHVWSGYAGLRFRHKALLHTHCLQAVDLAGRLPQAWRDRLITQRALRVEAKLLRLFPFQSALTPELQAAIMRLSPKARVELVPLPLDLRLYPYIEEPARPRAKRVILIGSMLWIPTQIAAIRLLTRLWPAVKKAEPEAELEITGWGAEAVLQAYKHVPGLTVHSDVTEIAPYFARGTVFVYPPEQGSGVKVKVMEAMAYGVPVVTTPPGIEGLAVAPGVHAEVASEDSELVNEIIALLRDEGRQQKLRLAARRLIAEECTSERSLVALEHCYAMVRRAQDYAG